MVFESNNSRSNRRRKLFYPGFLLRRPDDQGAFDKFLIFRQAGETGNHRFHFEILTANIGDPGILLHITGGRRKQVHDNAIVPGAIERRFDQAAINCLDIKIFPGIRIGDQGAVKEDVITGQIQLPQDIPGGRGSSAAA